MIVPPPSVPAWELEEDELELLEPEPPHAARPRTAAAAPGIPMKFLRVKLFRGLPFRSARELPPPLDPLQASEAGPDGTYIALLQKLEPLPIRKLVVTIAQWKTA